MLLGGDLGFLARVVVASLVVIFAPVVGFVVRRKWRRSVARREEIKRLLVLASEETARAELQAEAETDFGYGYEGYNGYGYRSSVAEVAAGEAEAESVAAAEVEIPVEVQVQAPPAASVQAPRQCEVCRSPATTRCARCKAVRYCSSKCQIIHWRQGHKDECCPFTFNHQSHDMGGTPPKLLKAKQNEIHKNGIEIGGSHPAKAVEISSGEASDSSLSNSSDWEENEVEDSTDKKERNSKSKLMAPELNEVSGLNSSGSSIDASASTLHKHSTSRSVGIRAKTETNCANADQTKPFLEHSNLVSSSVNYEPVPIDVDSLRGSSTSSASSVDGCNESSFSEPSTPSSGFWEATVNLTRSRIDAFDDVAYSCCDESVHLDDVLSSQLSSCCSSELLGSVLPQRDMPGTCDKKVLSDDPRISMCEEKPSTNGSSAPVKENKGSLEFHRSSASSLKRSDHVDFSDFSIKKVSNSREPGELALSKDDKAGSLPFSNPEKINCKISGQISFSQEPKPVELKSLSSKASSENLYSNHGRHTFQNVKPVKAVSAHEPPAYSSDFLGHTQNTRNSSKPSVWKVVDQLRASKITQLTSLGGVGENVGKYYSKGLFPYDLFVMLYNWNKVELIPCGLMNCGNSCYANVVLQCLAFTPPLTAYFLQGLHSKACKKRDWCFTCEFESLVLKAKDGNSPISPSRIISQLQNIGTNLGNGREEDAHEFLRCAIDTMQSGCLEEAGISASGSLEDTTLLGLTFGGYLRSKIECMRCGGKSERHEKMMDLTVEIEGDIGTLEEALRQFTRTETLDGENKYQCSRCKSYEKAKKKLRVLEAPNVLTIALKRFQSGKFGKLNKTIKFPEILDLAPYMSGTSDKSPIYRLYGVIVHLDIMNTAFSGHYVCYVKNTQNKWFKIDDSMVKGVELESVLTKGSYMLLYARCSPRAPRLIRSTLVPRDPRKSKHPDSGARYHARGRWDVPANDSSNNQTSDGCFSPNCSSFQPFHTIWAEDSSSDKSSSLFSEVNSCSTDSSNRDSMCSDDLFDQIQGGDTRVFWGSSWRNSSDSEASSSSSSPSPLYARHSLHDSEAYASKYPVATDHCIDTAVPAFDDRLRFRGHSEVEVTGSRGSTPFLCPDSDKESNSFLCPDSTKSCSKLGSSSCREIGSGKLRRLNPFENLKSSVTVRRSIREKD